MLTASKRYLQTLQSEFKQGWVGLHLVFGVAIASRFLHGLISDPTLSKSISEILLAVLLGLYIRNWVGFGDRARAGVQFAIKRILRFGIVLLGLRLSFQDVVETGIKSLALMLRCLMKRR